MFGVSTGRNRRNERVLRVGQTGDRIVSVILVIVIASAIAYIGIDVNAEIDDSTDVGLEGDDFSIVNESVSALNFTSDDTHFYTVSKETSGDAQSFDDDEKVFNTTSDTQLTEATDYEWFPANGTVRIDNTSESDQGATDIVITYNGTDRQTDFAAAQENVSGGFTDAMGLTDVVFIVLMFSVILGALLAFRQQT